MKKGTKLFFVYFIGGFIVTFLIFGVLSLIEVAIKYKKRKHKRKININFSRKTKTL